MTWTLTRWRWGEERGWGAAGDVGQGWWAEEGLKWCWGCMTEVVGRAELVEEHEAQGAVQLR